MSIIKPKLSSLVSGQLPEFIQGEYPVFVAFLKAYYDYLEDTTITDFDTVSNIDTTLDSFIIHFKNEIALNFPNTLLDDRFLLPKLKELYTSKGTEESYRLLFRILYNKEIEVGSPPTQMLRVSDGKWVQNNSIFATVNNGTPDSIVGQYIDIVSSSVENKKIKVFVDRYEPTTDINTFEFFIDGNTSNIIKIGDILTYSTNFTAFIIPTPSLLNIIQPGKNFTVGQTYNLESIGTGSTILVTEVDVLGGIKRAKFNSFGVGYLVDFSTNLLSHSYKIDTGENYFTVSSGVDSYDVTIRDSIDVLTDSGSISLYNYASTSSSLYVDPSYVGELKQTFNSSTVSEKDAITKDEYAVLSIKLGSIAKYTGYYKNNDGFLDDTMYIQDSKYYQSFSYSIKINELFDSYKSVIKNLIHPAGTELFGEYTIDNVFTINSTATSLNYISAMSSFITEDGIDILTETGNMFLMQEESIGYDVIITTQDGIELLTETGLVLVQEEYTGFRNDIITEDNIDVLTEDGLVLMQEIYVSFGTDFITEDGSNVLTEESFLLMQDN